MNLKGNYSNYHHTYLKRIISKENYFMSKYLLNFQSGHLLLSMGFLIGSMLLALLAIIALDSLEIENQLVLYLIEAWAIATPFMTFYIALFTRFNNPFKKKLK